MLKRNADLTPTVCPPAATEEQYELFRDYEVCRPDTLPLPARHLIRDYASHYFINLRKPLALMVRDVAVAQTPALLRPD